MLTHICVYLFVDEMPVHVIVLGHSFVSRFQRFCDERSINHLGLDPSYFNVEYVGFGGLSLRQRRRLHSYDQTKLKKADLVILDIGSNDLSSASYLPEQFALDLVSYASFLIIGLGISKVAILQQIRRERLPFQDYNDHIVRSNVAMDTLIKTTQLPVVFWKHRGMWNCGQSVLCPDGVHLSNDIGYPKYLRSLRDCVIRLASQNLDSVNGH